MPIRWLRLALADLDLIYDHISKDSVAAATHLIAQIWASAQLLEQHPNMGRAGRVTGTRELIVQGTTYIIPYRVKEGEIQILRVLHTSMEWPKTF